MGKEAERPGLPEFLRELAFEEMLHVDRRADVRIGGQAYPSLRVGLAATAWQLQQSIALLQRQCQPNPLAHLARGGTAEASLDRVVALAMGTSLNTARTGALATIWLRREGENGLPADYWPGSRRALEQMRSAGKRLVAVEAWAFDDQIPSSVALKPMLNVMKRIVVDMWDATDIVICCPRAQLAHYCGKLGFSRVAGQGQDVAHANSILLHMPAQRMAQAPAQHDAEALSA
jgi:hypothetical protein